MSENHYGGNTLPEIAREEHQGNMNAKRVYDIVANSLIPSAYDYIALTYVATGNGAGEIETVTFKSGGSGGTTVATLTLAYNASDEISSVTKS